MCPAEASRYGRGLATQAQVNKQRSYPLRGFGSCKAAARFCTAPDNLRDYFRCPHRAGETVPLATRRQLFRDRWAALMTLLAA